MDSTQKYTYKRIAILLIAIIATVVMIVVLNLFTNSNDQDKQTEVDNQSIVESQKEIHWKDVLTLDISNIPMKPLPFEVGDEYKYSITINKIFGQYNFGDPLNYDSAIYVEDKIKINNSEYYVIREKNITKNTYIYFKTNDGKLEPFEYNMTLGGCVIKINKENGKILSSFTYGTRCYLLEDIVACPLYYIYGYLNRTSKFEFGGEIEGIKDIIEVEVVGIEKIKNRECFKVEMQEKKKIGGIIKIEGKSIYWVDIEKRIPIKIQKYEDNVLVRSIISLD